MHKPLFWAPLVLSLALPAFADDISDGMPEVQLEEVTVTARKDTITYLTQTDFERKTANTLWEAVRGVPGVFRGESGGRGESTISIRGSTRYQVGMYVDDIPVATAFRNEWNADNSLMWDIESVEIAKGFTSPLLASNNGMAGTINLRTAKPKKELDFKARYMNYFDNRLNDMGRMMGISLGTRQEFFYTKLSFAENQRDHFRLSSDFEPGRFQPAGRRLNSDFKNHNLNAMVGFTPTRDIDVMLGYTRQRFERGQPINASPDAPATIGAGGTQTRAWRWPVYDTDRYYLNAEWNVTEKAHLKFITYYDKHKDKTEDYSDADFTIRNISGDQLYDQYTAGAHLRFDYTFNDQHKLSTSAGYRRLSHRGYRWTNAGAQYLGDENTESYIDLGVQYTFNPVEQLTLVAGASYTYMDPDKVDRYDASGNKTPLQNKDSLDESMFNWQFGAFYDLTKKHQIFATVARKSRIGTMEERFYRNSAGVLPQNPDLGPERAMHYELGYRGIIQDKLKLNASVYYSDIKDQIIREGSGNNRIYRNVDKSRILGAELASEYTLNRYLNAGATYNYMHWDTRDSRGAQYLTYAPKHSGTVYAVVSPIAGLSIVPELYVTGSQYSSATAATNARSPGFYTVNLKAMYDVRDNFMVEVGVKNLLDRDYYYSWGYNQPGLIVFAGLTVKY